MEGEAQNRPRHRGSLSLGEAAAHYAACLGGFAGCVWLGTHIDSAALSLLTAFVYFGSGVYLNRAVLPRLIEWHPMYDTLEGVTNEKLRFFFLWPIAYLGLFFRLAVNEVL